MQHIKDCNADVVFLSETWMRSDKDDITAMIKPYGYIIGGGIVTKSLVVELV